MHSFETSFVENGLKRIAGVDEAGRGPLAGPVVAAAVMFPPDSPLFQEERIRDSKSLSAKKREEQYWNILTHARIGIGVIGDKLIDQMNILQASLAAMRQAVLMLSATPDVLLIDGNHTVHHLPFEQVPIVDGDRKSISIAAASIVAKVTRDKIMERYDLTYPQYGFAKHKGYPTALHLASLAQHGPSPIHRLSFGPVAKYRTE